MRRNAPNRPAFTLIELLTVIAIITLLIGLVTPALNRARINAKNVATKAIYHSIEVGCEAFRNDNNEYPKSYAASFGDGGNYANALKAWELGSGTTVVSGANLIVDAMIGRDGNGYDPNPSDLTQTGAYFDRWNLNPQNGLTRKRVGPYVSDKLTTATNTPSDHPPRDKWATYGAPPYSGALPVCDANDAGLYCKVFLDKFDYPILYYRANPTATPQTKIIQSNLMASQPTMIGDGVYDGRDNMLFTEGSSSSGSASGNHHVIEDADKGLTGAEPYQNQRFVNYIRSSKNSLYNASHAITFSKPIHQDSFLLFSPGYDGIYGSNDDVKNWDDQ